MSDVAVFDYVSDDGRKMVFSYGVHGDPNEQRPMSVTIVVDDVVRLHSDTHWFLPAGEKLSELEVVHTIKCVSRHMIQYCMWDEGMVLSGEPERRFPVDARHIVEMTDEQAGWFNERANSLLILNTLINLHARKHELTNDSED